MNFANVFFALLTLVPASAFADVPSLDYWVQDAQKQVTFAPRPSLTVNLMVIAVDSADYGQLNVHLTYDQNPQAQAEIDALGKKFPGYQLSRAMLDASGAMALAIPSVGMNKSLAVDVSPNGPWFDFTTILTEAQTNALQKALQTDANAVAVTGNVQATIPVQKTVEHVELTTETCDGLLAAGSDLYTVMQQYAGVLRSIDGMTFQYASTADGLKRSVLDSCLSVAPQAISSFSALLAVPVAERADRRKPYGETQQLVPSQVQLPVKYDYSVGSPS